MTTGIRSDASGTFGALTFGGDDVLRFGSDNSGQLAGFRNKLINGGMQVAQRGTGAISVGAPAYTVDRWLAVGEGANITVQQKSIVSGEYNKVLSVIGAAGNTVAQVSQRIEGVNTLGLAGKNITISGVIVSGAGKDVCWQVVKANTLDNYSAVTVLASGTFTGLSNTFIKKETTISVPSDYAATGLELRLYVLGLLSGQEMYYTNFQLEEGSIATPFEHRPIGLEMSLCQRYYQQDAIDFLVRAFNQGALRLTGVKWPTMRVAPSLTITAFYDAEMGFGATVTAFGPISADGVSLINSTTGVTVDKYYFINLKRSAEL